MSPAQLNTYKPPKGIGYFLNILSKLNDWIERENKRGSDIPRFTKVQLRKMALYLERNHLFNFDALRADGGRARRRAEAAERARAALERGLSNVPARPRYTDDLPQMALANRDGTLAAGSAPAPVQGRPRPSWDDQVREFKRMVKEENKGVPSSVLDQFLL